MLAQDWLQTEQFKFDELARAGQIYI